MPRSIHAPNEAGGAQRQARRAVYAAGLLKLPLKAARPDEVLLEIRELLAGLAHRAGRSVSKLGAMAEADMSLHYS